MSNELGSLLSSTTGSTSKKEVGAWLRESPLSVGDKFENLIDKMNVHGFVFSLISSQCLINHLEHVLFADSSKTWKPWNETRLSLQNLADEECVLQLLTKSQMSFEKRIKDFIKSDFAVLIDKSILENTRRLVD